ncbi:MAG: WD40/YVTN/BNR-like repeat-containing protein [Candidatus Aminicenantales bacterium]
MKCMRPLTVLLVVFAALVATLGAEGQGRDRFNGELLRTFTFRNIAPFRMSARASAIAVPDSPATDHLYTFYAATWTGGVFKTTNNGTTFKPVFDGQNKVTIGAIAVASSDPKIVWVGTGDQRGARSSYPGDGVYKSADAGETWTNMGLQDSHHISRVVIHPENPDIVYAGVMGHLYSANEERGVFKTTDGGRTWKRALFVNGRIGVIDLVMNPRNPDILYAATYDMRRTPWNNVNAGPESGVYKTEDGGGTWTKLTGGLPTGRIGKIGLDIYLKDPEIVYALVNNCNPGPKPGRAGGCTGGQRAGLMGGELYRTEDGGKVWTKMNSADDDLCPKGSGYIGSGDEDCDGFTLVRVDPNNDQNVFAISVWLFNSTDGGRSWRGGGAPRPEGLFPGIFGDVRTLWIDPQNSDRMIIGDDGGFCLSYDGGKSSDHISHLPVGEVYSVGYDMADPYNIYSCQQDHEDWKAPSIGPRGYVSNLDWIAISSGDGMYTRVDPRDSRWAYTTSEWGGIFRLDQKLGYRVSIRPARPGGGGPYRSIWGTPLHLSPHDGSTLYTGGEVLLKSVDRGDHWTEISPDLSTNDGEKLRPSTEPGVQAPHYWFCISTIAESPVTPGVIWAGTSDGKVHVTRNGGGAWTDLTERIFAAGGPEEAYVSRVAASSHAAGRAYVSKSGNKEDDFRPFLFMTDDFGATWTSISRNLPNEPIHVVWEDDKNPDLLFVGNGGGVFVSIDRGKKWVKMNNNIPNTPVLDLAVHPREHDLIVGSMGRGVFVTNIGPLQELNDAILEKEAHLFAIKPAVQRIIWNFAANDRLFSQRYLITPNEADGMMIRYYLKNVRNDAVRIVITDSRGTEVARLEGETSAGLNTVVWNMRVEAGRARAGGGRGAYSPDQWQPLGAYVVALEVGGQKITQPAQIIKTQGWAVETAFPSIIREQP